MAAPTMVQEVETVWDTSTTPKVTANFNVLANDRLVVITCAENFSTGNAYTITGGSLTWTLRQEIAVATYTHVAIYTATVDSDKTMAASIALTGGLLFGGSCFTFRGSDGIGASAKANTTGAPSLDLVTTGANSAIVVVNGDGVPQTGARTWRTGAGSLTETSYAVVNVDSYVVYGGYHADAGSIGTKTVGLSAPTGQRYALAACEITGTATGGRTARNTHAWPLGMNLGMHHWHNG